MWRDDGVVSIVESLILCSRWYKSATPEPSWSSALLTYTHRLIAYRAGIQKL